MIALKRAVIVANVVAGLLGVSLAAAQEMSVEESYLQESVENMIIREQSQTMGRDMKLVALEYINQAIKRGNTSADVRNALEYLALEGLTNQTRENGRLINNFPDIRRQAVIYLGEIGTPEAKDTLLKVMLAETELMVLTEAVKSLAKIGVNDNEETANAIAWVVRRYNTIGPDNLLALASLEAFETLAKKSGGLKDPNTLRSIMLVANGRYIKSVQDRAQQLLSDLRQYSPK